MGQIETEHHEKENVLRAREAEVVMAMVSRIVERYLVRWSKSRHLEFRAAADEVKEHLQRMKEASVNKPGEFLDEWECAGRITEIAVMNKVYTAARKARKKR